MQGSLPGSGDACRPHGLSTPPTAMALPHCNHTPPLQSHPPTAMALIHSNHAFPTAITLLPYSDPLEFASPC
jgi:hypothetical protein